jgi:acetylornithine deacetylase/succinyl-diaminopimelate desuccinylase-like protein
LIRFVAAAAAAAIGFSAVGAQAQERPDQTAFKALYKELVETNTTLSSGSCTLAAERMAARLKTAGYPDADLRLFTAEGHPKEGGLVAVLPGSDPKLKAVLLLAHIDVVEAKREDWERDPFQLVEEGGYFYARGASDDKSMAAIWTDSLIRFRQEGYRPRRTIKMALTCGEETAGAFNGAQYLSEHQRDLIDAAFALNEGAAGETDKDGRKLLLEVQAGEKVAQNFRLEVTNPGGHSSRPVKDNAIYHLAGALTRIGAYDFPIQTNDATRGYFSAMARIKGGEISAAMQAVVADPADAKAVAVVAAADPSWNAILHTTCVATMLDAGHATNALPQRARANVNCRIFPGVPVEEVRKTLEQVAADPQVKVTTLEIRGPVSSAPPLTPEIMRPIEKIAADMWPGLPVVPIMQAGATDGQFLNGAGIPTYGVEGIFYDPDLGHIHGLNERLGVQSLYDGRDFLYRLVKAYTK